MSDLPIMNKTQPIQSFQEFYVAHFGRMVALATTIVGDSIFAEDIVQSAMTTTWNRWSEISGYDKPGAWTRRLVVNQSIDRKRRLAREGKALVHLAPNPRKPFTEGIHQNPWTAVAKLKPKQRAAIALYYIEGYTTVEVAEILGCRTGTARSLLSRAREALRIDLQDE